MYARYAAILVIAALGVGAARHALSQQQQLDPFQQAACQEEFNKLRNELERRGLAVKSAGQKKSPAPEMCKLLRNFTGTESQMVKFLTEKQAVCGIPEQLGKQAKEGHAKALAMRDQVCKVAENPQAVAPPSQGLSGALGPSAVGGAPPETSGGSGVFDTLTGNVLRQ
jgi:hypothetical protein